MKDFLTVTSAVICFFTFVPLVIGLLLSDLVCFTVKKTVGHIYPIIDGHLAGRFLSYDVAKMMISLLVRFVIFISSDGTSKNQASTSHPGDIKATPAIVELNSAEPADTQTTGNTEIYGVVELSASEVQEPKTAHKNVESVIVNVDISELLSQTIKEFLSLDGFVNSIYQTGVDEDAMSATSKDSDSDSESFHSFTTDSDDESDSTEESIASQVFKEELAATTSISNIGIAVTTSITATSSVDCSFELPPTISCEENLADAAESIHLRTVDFLDDVDEAWRVWDRYNEISLPKCRWILLDIPDVFGDCRGPVLKLTTPEGKVKYPQDMRIYDAVRSWADEDVDEDGY
ncbi:hypothetical protein CMQ_149 [Grosmannia clavigera kw1407]|uniref:Uncharacterized protein n=1 Tax=Grosmannia clavigera (strain kw1407 / UAMH 11150) TaxID=655863 RepID=F0XQW3_GROCL|nr:uncharacterized protein CMQ_149 [Grosmannia clavigera kw1407]EFW99831.1 hypothetical protein CMQ_149 [Grosmannia clavigera kw1407]